MNSTKPAIFDKAKRDGMVFATKGVLSLLCTKRELFLSARWTDVKVYRRTSISAAALFVSASISEVHTC